MGVDKYSLSVIITNYNKSKYIEECIQSVLNQTLLPDEIIVIDDASSDNSVEIIEKILSRNPIVRLVSLSKNGGVSRARNIGMETARSIYITFLDGDDFYGNVKKLENEMTLIKKATRDIVAYSKIMFVDESGVDLKNPPIKDSKYLQGNLYPRLLTGKFNFSTIARDYCFRKELGVLVKGYNESRNLYEDLEFTTKLAAHCKFYSTHEFGTAYRQIDSGLSSRSVEEHNSARKAIFHDLLLGQSKLNRLNYSIMWYSNKMNKFIVSVFWRAFDSIYRRNYRG